MRRAVTLLEVLIAVLVASVGLLGAIAVFPVAMSQVKKGQNADLSANCGKAAVAQFSAERMNEPARWIYWDAANSQPAYVLPPNPIGPTFNQSGHPLFGRAFCIDPRFFEQNRIADIQQGTDNSDLWSWFPAVPETAGNNAIPNSSRMVRVTLHNGNPSPPSPPPLPMMSFLQANKVFRLEDELIYKRPDDNSMPPVQLYTQVGGEASTRQEEGRMTWMATLVPKFGPAFTADSSGNITLRDKANPLGDEYVLSVVVYRDRSPDMEVPESADRPWIEWTAKILPNGFHGGGIGGGEVTITTNASGDFAAPEYLGLRSGSWIALGRTIPTAAGPVQAFQWYRVSGADDVRPAGNRWSQDATLVGPDWQTDLVAPIGVAEECDVIIVPQISSVFERTIQLTH